MGELPNQSIAMLAGKSPTVLATKDLQTKGDLDSCDNADAHSFHLRRPTKRLLSQPSLVLTRCLLASFLFNTSASVLRQRRSLMWQSPVDPSTSHRSAYCPGSRRDTW